jgi:hypothetical protein
MWCTVTEESVMSLDRAAGPRREHAEIVRFCRQLGALGAALLDHMNVV